MPVIQQSSYRSALGSPNLPTPMKLAARLLHYALYALMIAMPMIGWALLSTANYAVLVLGQVRLPPTAPVGKHLSTLLCGLRRK